MKKLIVVLVVLACAVVAGTANAKIVVGKSIAGVALGVSENDVIATLGQPKKLSVISDPANPARQARTLNYGKTEVGIAVEPPAAGVVSLISTKSKKEKTANGVGVGTTEKTLRKKIKGLHCAAYGKGRQCVKGSGKPGTVLTGFILANGKKVTRIIIGRIESDS